MTKAEELRTKSSECPRGKAVVQQMFDHSSKCEPAAAASGRSGCSRSQTWLGRVLGLQLCSPVPLLLSACDVTAMAESTVHLDLCLIFLLLRFSLYRSRHKVQSHFRCYKKIKILKGCECKRDYCTAIKTDSYLRMRFFRHYGKETMFN